ncbi:MAG: hypothetical protein HKP45_02605, partial [Winogradskyella sp.]|nr:hypothetical protein [Winogradskyella sp.]
MEKENKGFLNRIKWIYKLTKHGLFLQGVRNNIAKLGIDIMPYYYFICTKERAIPQEIRGDELDLKFAIFDESDMM